VEKKLTILKNVLGSYYHTGNEYLFHCSFCNHHKRKLSVNIKKGYYKCWVCDRKGWIARLIKKFGTLEQLHAWNELTGRVDITEFDDLFSAKEVPEEQILKLPPEFVPLAGKNLSLTAGIPMRYLQKRDITKSDILKWKIGYCPSGQYAKRVIIPSFGLSGYVNYFVARSYDNSWRKYLNPSANKDIVFNHLMIDWEEPVMIVEGIFDAIVAGDNSVPILGSNLSENSVLFGEIVKHQTPVYIALDHDAKKKENRLIEKLLQYGIEVFKVDTASYEDVGAMAKSDFLDLKKKATLINSDNYLLYRTLSSL